MSIICASKSVLQVVSISYGVSINSTTIEHVDFNLSKNEEYHNWYEEI